VEFKRVLFLKKQMAQKLGRGSPELGEQDIFAMDALTLAYIGDVCWAFFIRKTLIDTGIYNVQILNSLASEMVSARQQSGGERMAQGVWRYRLLDASVACRVLYHYQYHGAREVCSAAVEEHILLFTGLDVHDVTVVKPVFYFS